MKVALLGGSFDPVHQGHLQMAVQAQRLLGVDEVWFLPAGKTPLKERQLTNQDHRLAMLKLVIEDKPHFRVNTLELDRDGTSYTIDTLTALHRQYPEHTFYWLMGNDQLQQFDKWKDPDRLVELAHFVCFDRDGVLSDSQYPIQCIHMPMIPVSSSDIRNGDKLNYLDERVLAYIYRHRLYVKQFVQKRVSPKRFSHSVSVAHLCEIFAKAHNLDVDKAYYIGLFHDICKNMDQAHMEPWMNILCPENKQYAPAVWHGFVGSEVVDRIFGLRDPQLKQAIYHHVLGTSTDPYAMIVFCADKLDPLRGYPVQNQIERVCQNLKEGFDLVKQENENYLKGKEA